MSQLITPMNMPGHDASDHDWRVFLEHQLAGAVHQLRAKDATEQACIQRLDVKYLARFDAQQKTIDRQQETVNRITLTFGDSHRRYMFLREHQVQIWTLGVAATGEQLDHALDEQIERAQKDLTASQSAGSPAAAAVGPAPLGNRASLWLYPEPGAGFTQGRVR